MNLVLSGPIDPTLLNLAVGVTQPREVVRLHERAHRLVGAEDDESSRREIDRLCDLARVDHAFVPEGVRFSDFKLLAMDMDSTLITIECIDEIADFAGKKREVAAITEAAMRGEIPDFAESLRRRVGLLRGTSEVVLSQVIQERLTLSPGAKRLVNNAKVNNLTTVILSGGFTYFCRYLATLLEISCFYANELEIKNGKLTGRILGKVIDGNAKADAVDECATNIGADITEVMVIGDGANDIPMMKQTNVSIAYHAKPAVNKVASHQIKFGGLDVVIDWFPSSPA